MAYDAKTERLIALKKLAGKAQTSNDKGLANEALPSGITSTSETIFGETISTSPSNSSLYTITGKVEYLRFPVSFIAGSDTPDGRHGFELKLPSDYEANSSNTKAGTYPFQNGQSINITSGSLQLVPPSFATDYEAKPFYGGTSAKDSGTQIPLLDARDWYLDYFNGIFFQQDPSGTGDQLDNPDYVEAYLYIGDMLDTVVANAGGAGGGDSGAQYLVLQATGSLTAERVFNPSTGISVSDGGAGGNYTLTVDNSVVATLTGSQFSSNVGITGSLGVTSTITSPAISGSLTHLTDGTSYLIAGSGITITSASNGAITITNDGTVGDITSVTAGTGLTGGGSSGDVTLNIDNSVVATLTGSQFSGNVGITGSFGVQGDVEVTEYIKHIGDDDTFIQFADDAIGITAGGEQLITISEAGQDIVKIGDGGDVDFQVRTLGDDNTLYVQGDTDRIGIGTNSPSSIVHIKEAGPILTLQRENNSNASTIDFLGALGNTANSITHDSSTNDLVFKTFNGSAVEEIMRVGDHYGTSNRQIILLSGSGLHAGAMQPRQTADIAFFVSGSIGSRGTSDRGTSVFGGDTAVSGAIMALGGISGSLTHLTDGTSYLIAGNNITITTGSSGAVTVSSTGGFTRSKFTYELTASHAASSNLNIPDVDFSSVSYDSQKIDIFVNGQLMTSGSSKDYILPGSLTGSVNFNFDLLDDDIIAALIY